MVGSPFRYFICDTCFLVYSTGTKILSHVAVSEKFIGSNTTTGSGGMDEFAVAQINSAVRNATLVSIGE